MRLLAAAPQVSAAPGPWLSTGRGTLLGTHSGFREPLPLAPLLAASLLTGPFLCLPERAGCALGRAPASAGGTAMPQLLGAVAWGPRLRPVPPGSQGRSLRHCVSLSSRAKSFTHRTLWTWTRWSDLASLGRVVWPAGLGRPTGHQPREGPRPPA